MKKNCLILFLILHSALGQSQDVETISIKSAVFNDDRQIKVSLPRGYKDNPSRNYIVAYLFDAQSDVFFKYIKATVDYLAESGYINPLILVGVSAGNRQYEFTPKSETEAGAKNFSKSGGADTLALYLRDEIMPAIKSKYRCSNYNIAMGHSLGGTFVTYCLLKHPSLFNAAFAISPNYQYDSEQLVRKLDSLQHPQILAHKFLYIAYGKDDMYEERFKPATKRIDSILKKKDIPGLTWQVTALDNDRHGTTGGEGMLKGLVALYREFTLSGPQFNALLNDTSKAFIEHVKKYYKTQSALTGMQLPLINDINGLGYNCFYSRKGKAAVDVFTWALSLYPDDINLYDSMGEIQQETGNNKEATRYYTRGLAVVEEQKSKLESKTYEYLVKGFKDRIKSVKNP